MLSTLRQAADLDYGLTVLRDGCADPDEDDSPARKVFPRQADVVIGWTSSMPLQT